MWTRIAVVVLLGSGIGTLIAATVPQPADPELADGDVEMVQRGWFRYWCEYDGVIVHPGGTAGPCRRNMNAARRDAADHNRARHEGRNRARARNWTNMCAVTGLCCD